MVVREGGIFIHFLGFQTLIIILKLYRVCNLLQFSPSSNWLVFLWHSYGCCKCQCVCESFGHLCDTEPLWQEITKFCPKIHLKSGKSHHLLVSIVFHIFTIITKCKSVLSLCFFYTCQERLSTIMDEISACASSIAYFLQVQG